MSTYQGSFIFTKRSPRVIAELPADFRILMPNNDREQYSLKIKTLSGGGISFLSPVLLTVGTEIEMTLYKVTVPITFTAEVTWTEKLGDFQVERFKCGLKFTQISDEDLANIYQIVVSYLDNTNSSS
jgi:hypothetical protein